MNVISKEYEFNCRYLKDFYVLMRKTLLALNIMNLKGNYSADAH
ncbi:hypothetical protein RABR111495_23985 [Rahnella bruchi]